MSAIEDTSAAPARTLDEPRLLIPLSLLALYVAPARSGCPGKSSPKTAAQMLCASVALLLVGFGTGEQLPAHPTLRATAAVVYLALVGSIVAFSAYLYVLKHARPALATSYAYVNPPVAVLFGVLLAGEHVGPFDLGGMAIILVGVGVITLARKPAH
jgi:drug/metabolite transporter (DMT)-like permease